jgi:hypothetical protein
LERDVIFMGYSPPAKCSVCGGVLNVSRLTCPTCSSEVTGSFDACKFCGLNDKLKLFLDTFLQSRGSIKEVEKSLSISYPTVKSLLDELLLTLYPDEKPRAGEAKTSAEILDMLENGEITAAKAAEMLARL